MLNGCLNTILAISLSMFANSVLAQTQLQETTSQPQRVQLSPQQLAATRAGSAASPSQSNAATSGISSRSSA